MTSPTIYLHDYQPPTFAVVTVKLTFDLYDDHTIVHNLMHLKRQYPGELRLQGEALELLDILQDDQPLSSAHYRFDGEDLVIPAPLDDCMMTVITKIYPHQNTELSGLFRSRQLFCTQCEAEGFRRITYFPDRPDVLSIYTTKITADQTLYPVLLSNGNLQESGQTADGRHWVEWHDPFPKPSYLFALVAGDLACVEDEFVTCTDVRVSLRLYVEHGNEDQCEHALISLKRAMRWDEEHYGRVYDLSIFMIVAVSDFNMGAMENKGLNIFNSKFILARPDTATDEDYAYIESVVAHEYFHNWTGNRVTCRDWFQLSLKEGLTVFRDQEFSRDMNSREVNRINDVKILRSIQFPEDAGSMAHAVRPASYQEISNFYTATIYDKGSEVIRMQYLLLGAEGFRRGTDLYFERHDGEAVTIDDFVAAMEDANGVDLTQFKRWYSQAGTPVVTVKKTYRQGCLTLMLTQSCPPTPETDHKEPFHIPIQIALFDKHGQKMSAGPSLLECRDVEQVFEIDGLKEEPLVSLLRDFSAPIILKTDATEDDMLRLLRYETDGFSKWDAAQNMMREAIDLDYKGDSAASLTKQGNILDVLDELMLDDSIDPALRAELLTPPSFEDLASTSSLVDVERLVEARLVFSKALGKALYSKAQQLFLAAESKMIDSKPGVVFGWRKLRLRCLRLMLLADEHATLPICEALLTSSQTMSEQLAGFSGLVHSQNLNARSKACDVFYQQWSHDDLVLDKWFRVQAMPDRPDVLDDVRALLSHPKFQFTNPNKVRALINSFVQANPRQFHALDAKGYRFLTEQLLTLDKINSQGSARLAVPFSRWQRLDKPRQILIQAELKQLAAHSLSKDLSELVNKSLQ